jgi:CRISPR-associated protein Cmr6
MRVHVIAMADTENPQQPRGNDRRPMGQHAGQLLQRFLADSMLDPKTGRKREKRDPEESKALFRAAIAASRCEPLGALYQAAYARWIGSFSKNGADISAKLGTAGRLVVGLGSESVLETGLRLHHTYGVPIIPGSALKGLASHYCHDVWGQRHDAAAREENKLFRCGGRHHSLLFGTTDDGGVITFNDAWIVPESLSGALRLDVMTPHHPKWQTNDAPPTDFDSPKPVSFLSVAGTFDIRLSWSGPADTPRDQAGAWTALAMKLLQEALAEWGVGGKTSSGYGRLVPSPAAQAGRQPSSTAPAKQLDRPKPGQRVEARLLEERTKKGGWKAVHAPSGLVGPIQNSGDVPIGSSPGDTMELIVANATDFRYPTPAEEARAQRAPDRGRGAPGKGGRRR